eukprot:363192-Chlamydomonas_euryale.AAC.4
MGLDPATMLYPPSAMRFMPVGQVAVGCPSVPLPHHKCCHAIHACRPGNSGLPEHASAAPQKLPPPVGGGSGSSGGSDGDKRAQSKADRSAAADTQPEASGAGGSCSAPPAEAATRGHYSDVIGRVNRYTMPNIASMLPNYANGDAEFIFRTFNTGNYDMLKHLPQVPRRPACILDVWWRCMSGCLLCALFVWWRYICGCRTRDA